MDNKIILTANQSDKTFEVTGAQLALYEDATISVVGINSVPANSLTFQIWYGGIKVAECSSFTEETSSFDGDISLDTQEMRDILGQFQKRTSKEFTVVLWSTSINTLHIEGKLDILTNMYNISTTPTPLPTDEYMLKSVYDIDDNGVVELSAGLFYGTGRFRFYNGIFEYSLNSGTTYSNAVGLLGEWNIEISYSTDQMVACNGIIYKSLADNNLGKDPVTETAEWLNINLGYDNHIDNKSNPHEVTVEQLSLENVDNTSDADKPISDATQTALDLKLTKNPSITGATKTKITYDENGLVTDGEDAIKDDVGLDQVDNTSDADKPVSDDTQTALNLKVDTLDIVDNLTSTDENVPLSANQGRVLNQAISNAGIITATPNGGQFTLGVDDTDPTNPIITISSI